MKYLNTILLLLIAVGLGINFYMDAKRDNAYKAQLQTVSTAPAKDAEPSPFDKLPDNPMDNNQKPPVHGATTISFERTAHDFGRVETGPSYTTSFKYKNTGSEDLYISAAEGSCGCTVPKWSREAVKPGDSGEIQVQFDSKGRQGRQLKTVTVTTNTEPPLNVLTIDLFLYLRTQ